MLNQPVSMLSDSYTAIGHGAMPVIIFLVVAVIFHIALRYTKYGKYTYAIGGNMQAARTSGINVKRHLVIVYSIAGLLARLAGVVASARAATGQAGMGMSYGITFRRSLFVSPGFPVENLTIAAPFVFYIAPLD